MIFEWLSVRAPQKLKGYLKNDFSIKNGCLLLTPWPKAKLSLEPSVQTTFFIVLYFLL